MLKQKRGIISPALIYGALHPYGVLLNLTFEEVLLFWSATIISFFSESVRSGCPLPLSVAFTAQILVDPLQEGVATLL